ncbi:MAG: MBL fold metallo-hydrolase [Proteobacteria bacterium]|nr:MBL fold metallo-hydrolase [Pseudomonadota bacterium]
MMFRQMFDYDTWTYTYLLYDPENMEGILIDSVKEQVDRDVKQLEELGVTLKYSLETHVHADHITGADDIRQKTGAEVVYGAGAKVPCSDIDMADGEELTFGRFNVKALATPGHTDGCTSYVVDGRVFTGDAMLVRGCGRTDFQQGSADALYESVNQKLFALPDDTRVYPAHDYKGMQVSTIGEEKKYNPRLGGGKSKAKFIEIMSNLNLAKPKRIDEAVPANMKCGKG